MERHRVIAERPGRDEEAKAHLGQELPQPMGSWNQDAEEELALVRTLACSHCRQSWVVRRWETRVRKYKSGFPKPQVFPS